MNVMDGSIVLCVMTIFFFAVRVAIRRKGGKCCGCVGCTREGQCEQVCQHQEK